MTHLSENYIHNRVLKLNIGFLLTAGPGHNHNSTLDLPTVKVAEDLTLRYVRGPIRLSCTKEGVLVQATLDTVLDDECYRCLDPIQHQMTIELEELFATDYAVNAEFFIGEDGILDLAPLLRAEVLIQKEHGMLCQTECQGLCPECGINRNRETCECDLDNLDPRFAVLKQLLDSN